MIALATRTSEIDPASFCQGVTLDDRGTLTLDLSKNRELLGLHRCHPYLGEVLLWLQGKLPFESIGHSYTNEVFKEIVLNDLLDELSFVGLIDHITGRPVEFSTIVVRDVQKSFQDQLTDANRIARSCLVRAEKSALGIECKEFKVRVKPELLQDALQYIEILFGSIQSDDDSNATTSTICLLGIKGA